MNYDEEEPYALCDETLPSDESDANLHRPTLEHDNESATQPSISASNDGANDNLGWEENVCDGIEYPYEPNPYPDSSAKEWQCHTCNSVPTNDWTSFLNHLKSGKHCRAVRRREVQRLQEARDPRVFCSICNVCCHPGQMKSHRTSLAHLLVKDRSGLLSAEESASLALARRTKRKPRAKRNKSKAPQTSAAPMETAQQLPHSDVEAVDSATSLAASSCRQFDYSSAETNFSADPDMVHAYLPRHLLVSLLGPVGAEAAIKSSAETMSALVSGSEGTTPAASAAAPVSKFSCDLCNIQVDHVTSLNNHLEGFAHARKSGSITPDSKYWARLQKEKAKVSQQRMKKRKNLVVAAQQNINGQAAAAADSAAADGGTTDGGAIDGGAIDGGAIDGGAIDGGAIDGGSGIEQYDLSEPTLSMLLPAVM